MFVSITTTDTSGTPEKEGAIVGEEMDGWLRELDGYRGLVLLAQPGVTLGLAFWESREAAERHASVRPSSGSACSASPAPGSSASTGTRSRSRVSRGSDPAAAG